MQKSNTQQGVCGHNGVATTKLTVSKFLAALLLVLFAVAGFAQQPLGKPLQRFTLQPGTVVPSFLHTGGVQRGSNIYCDTVGFLDYNTYNEILADSLAIQYTGSINGPQPQPYVEEISSSQITFHSAANQVYSYVMTAFDTLVFSDFNNLENYSFNKNNTIITLDTLGVLMSITGDTVQAHGTMINDSLVFRFYPVIAGVVDTIPVKSIKYTGYAGLAPFLTGPEGVTFVSIPVQQAFGLGQGFAVRMDYYNQDTSSHGFMTFGYADSCGTVVIQGNTYPSPAYPTPFIASAMYGGLPGSSFFGLIDSISPTLARVDPGSDALAYNIPGLSVNCSYTYFQNWQFLPQVSVRTLGVDVNQPNPLVINCSSPDTITVTPIGNTTGVTYAWSGNSSTDSTAIVNAAGAYTVTVTNAQNCTATATTVVECTTGIADITFESNINLMPNPTTGNTNLIITGANRTVTVTIYNMLGQAVKQYATTQSPVVYNQTIDLHGMATGPYLVRVESGNNIATKKLLVIK